MVREKQEEVRVAINGNQEEEKDDCDNSKEVEAEEERKKGGLENRLSLGGDPVKETAEKQQEEEFEKKGEDVENQSVEEVEGQETDKRTNKTLEGQTSEKQGGEDSSNKITKLNIHHHNTGEELQGQEDNLKPTISQSLIVDSEPPAGQKNKHGQAVKEEEQEMRQTPSPPKTLSARIHFQSQANEQESQVKTKAKEMFQIMEKAQTHPVHEANVSEENSLSEGNKEEEPPSIKVSELKKLFEA